jgi:type IV secretion system protein VirB9
MNLSKIRSSYLVVLLIPLLATATQTPQPLTTDHRIRVVAYDPNNVVTIHGNQLVQTSIQLSDNETIVGVESGDSVAWAISINPNKPNVLFLKPTTEISDTNLSVITDKNIYHFQLTTAAKTQKDSTYNVRFTYPLEEKNQFLVQWKEKQREKNSLVSAPPVNPLHWNWDYSFSKRCAQDLVPQHVFDDGKFTYFQFKPQQDIPAIFVVNTQGQEALANWRMEGRYVVVERTATQFSLRNDHLVSCVLNDKTS